MLPSNAAALTSEEQAVVLESLDAVPGAEHTDAHEASAASECRALLRAAADATAG